MICIVIKVLLEIIYNSVEEPKAFELPARSKVEQPIELTLPYSKYNNGKNGDLHRE